MIIFVVLSRAETGNWIFFVLQYKIVARLHSVENSLFRGVGKAKFQNRLFLVNCKALTLTVYKIICLQTL